MKLLKRRTSVRYSAVYFCIKIFEISTEMDIYTEMLYIYSAIVLSLSGKLNSMAPAGFHNHVSILFQVHILVVQVVQNG